MEFTQSEREYCQEISKKDRELREFLAQSHLSGPADARAWYEYLSAMKLIQGNLNNSLSFIATLLAKMYLAARFALQPFDAAAKRQGAAGHDIDVRTTAGERIVGEIKTVYPYGVHDFGAAQKREFKKDIARLQAANGHHKFLFVTEEPTFAILSGPKYSAEVRGLVVVDLICRKMHGQAHG